jgi:Rhodopirellula transposase DDE domain
LADELGIPITVCHYPPGTSKWNKIEHRLFSFISLTWKGQPLINYETVVNLIGATTTKSGLRVKAVLDTNEYQTGVKVSNSQMEELALRRHSTHPAWNYTLRPRA